jgi:hypothetical protein
VVTQLFADESKRQGRGFVMVAVEYPADDVKQARAQLLAQCRPGQRRIHFKSENDAIRSQVVKLLKRQGTAAHVYVAQSTYEPQARADCLQALGNFAISAAANRLVIERDQTRDADDRRILTEVMRTASRRVPWELLPPTADPLLWAADAIAWCWTHPDRTWRNAVSQMIANVSTV